MDLSDWRARIDSLNLELLNILNKRAECALHIAQYKRENHLPILDLSREAQILDALQAHNLGPLPHESIKRIFEAIMEEHRNLQNQVGIKNQ